MSVSQKLKLKIILCAVISGGLTVMPALAVVEQQQVKTIAVAEENAHLGWSCHATMRNKRTLTKTL